MWVDALLSAGLAAIAVVVSPVVAIIGVPSRYWSLLAGAALVLAAALAACGAVTAVLIVRRLQSGDYLLPARLRLPLPEFMRPPTARPTQAGVAAR